MTDLTLAYITALTGSPDTPLDWRVIHDRDRRLPAKNLRGTYADLRETLHSYNQQGCGVFCNINALDGQGASLSNVAHIRTHVVDLDDPATAAMSYEQAAQSAHFAVQSSAGKYHVYWLVEPYTGNDFYTLHQRKLAQLYQGDPSINDATRVLRVPGFYHCKGDPFLVQCWGIADRPRYTAEQIQSMLQHVNVVERVSMRSPLGTAEMQAPALDWCVAALQEIDPQQLSYDEWRNITAAYKQAAWSHGDEPELYRIWSDWCGEYSQGGDAENRKLWNSLIDTQLGWKSLLRYAPNTSAHWHLQPDKKPPQGSLNPVGVSDTQTDNHPTPFKRKSKAEFGDMIFGHDAPEFFAGCVFIEREGKVFTSEGRYLNSTQFNGKFGGKKFAVDGNGGMKSEAWFAALNSTLWTIPTVDHVRFLPNLPQMEIIEDDMGRLGVNTYLPPKIDMREGDISIFHTHMEKIMPDANDRKIYYDYMAHVIKYPGYKIQFAPLLQSAEGIGKSAFLEIMGHALGQSYVYSPNAQELVASGSKFNAWMRGKLAIMVNEIKVDERRELIEVLKPMITDNRIEIQAKGVDQDMEDNVANWFFFSNFKDAIPVNKNGRRYAIFYSSLQTERDILQAGMDKAYFDRFWKWLRKEGGLQALTYYFKHYPIEEGGIPVRAPRTSSYNEAVRISRSPVEVILQDAIEDGVAGFRGGFVSVEAALNKVRNSGVRNATTRTVQTVLENMNYYEIGKTDAPVIQENPSSRSLIYSSDIGADVGGYLIAQGYGL